MRKNGSVARKPPQKRAFPSITTQQLQKPPVVNKTQPNIVAANKAQPTTAAATKSNSMNSDQEPQASPARSMNSLSQSPERRGMNQSSPTRGSMNTNSEYLYKKKKKVVPSLVDNPNYYLVSLLPSFTSFDLDSRIILSK